MNTAKNPFQILVGIVLLLYCQLVTAVDYPLEIIELKSRNASETLPLLRPHLASHGSISGMRNQLIIRTSAENLQEIKRILQQIDRPPRQLLLQLRITHQSDASSTEGEIQSMVGKHNKIIVGQGDGQGIQYTVRSFNTQSESDLLQQVKTLDGHSAYLSIGKALPIRVQRWLSTRHGVEQSNTTRYLNAERGFYARPVLHGERVTVTFSLQRQQPMSSQQGFDLTATGGTVSGPLGTWLTIGSSDYGTEEDGQEIIHRYQIRRGDDQYLQLRVLPVE